MLAFNRTNAWPGASRRRPQDPWPGEAGSGLPEDHVEGCEIQDLAALLSGMLPISSILDLACGERPVAEQFLARGHRYTGVDASPAAIARATAGCPAASFMCCDLHRWRPHSRYHVVVAFNLLTRFVNHDRRKIVETALGWLTPNGLVAIAETVERQTRARPFDDLTEILARCGYRYDEMACARLRQRLPKQGGALDVRLAVPAQSASRRPQNAIDKA